MTKRKLKGFQELFNRQKVAERDALVAEREEYETANGSIKSLIDGLAVCEVNLKKTYEKINEGIVCNDSVFSNGINRIAMYNSKIINDRLELEELSQQLSLEINTITQKINALNSEIYWM